MKKIYKPTGQLALAQTLATMAVNDTLDLPKGAFAIRYLRSLSSIYGSATGKTFSVNMKEEGVTITRTF